MKTVLLCLILFCAMVLPSLGELTEADLNKIRLIVKEEINTEIESFEKNIKEYINTENENIEKQITFLTNFVYGLIALIVAAVAIPQVIYITCIWRGYKPRQQRAA